MIQETIILIAKKHQIWIEIVESFGCPKTIAEDITQEMYIKIQLKLEEGKISILYLDNNSEINYYYIFKTLKSLFIDLKRKSKNITMIELDAHLEVYGDTYHAHSEVDYIKSYNKIQDELDKIHIYKRRVFEIINDGESIAEFSRQSKISYYALYFTHKKVKDQLKKLL